eukprot:439859_1
MELTSFFNSCVFILMHALQLSNILTHCANSGYDLFTISTKNISNVYLSVPILGTTSFSSTPLPGAVGLLAFKSLILSNISNLIPLAPPFRLCHNSNNYQSLISIQTH